MQISKKHYNPEEHEVFPALSVKQPYASLLIETERFDENGMRHAAKEIEVRSRPVKFRGDLLICSSAKPDDLWHRFPAGVALGFVELYDVKPVSQFTKADWEATAIPVSERERYEGCFGWFFRNPRKVIQMPAKGQLGIFNIYYEKGDIMPYPQYLELGSDGWKKIQAKINGNK